MSRAAISVFVHGLYIGLLSITFFAAADLVLGLFGLPAHKDVFVYVAAMLLLYLAGFFIVSARNEVRDFFKLSVVTRYLTPFFLGAFVALGQAKVNLLLFAVPDVLLGTWTFLPLHADPQAGAAKAAVPAGTATAR
jgi:hypothetical protein